ncbi:MAG: DUF1854 domain-containing protein [Clostridia bacterium]|nr:DUF1854 domain-containing protein [Clostridia bacterium]
MRPPMGMGDRGRGGPHGGPGRPDRGPARSLAELSVTVWLTPENATFYVKNDFLHIKTETYEGRAHLCREFPFELEWEFISVMNEEQAEVGIIKSVSLFEGVGEELLRTELRRRYYAPVIDKILGVKERYGFSYWRVHTAEGNVSFTLHDTYRSIIRASHNRVVLLDVNGNRFEIPDVEALDRKSYKKIELYL